MIPSDGDDVPNKRKLSVETDWSQYGTACRVCGARPYHACLNTRISVTAIPTVPMRRPHVGRHVTIRKPYPREAAVRAAQTRLRKQQKSGRCMIKAENWKNRGYRPSDARQRQINRESVIANHEHE